MSEHPDWNRNKIIEAMESPLIVWGDDTPANFDSNEPGINWANGCPKIPFEIFRVMGHYRYLDNGYIDFKAWVGSGVGFNLDPAIVVSIEVVKIANGQGVEVKIGPIIVTVQVAFFMVAGDPVGKVKTECRAFDVNSRMSFIPKTNPDIRWSIAVEWLQRMCIDFQNPQLYLCKRHPVVPSGKSIHWQKCREHYVLIHKNHSANRKENSDRKVICDGPTIDRCAHARRAHFRLLSSPKFKAKRGQRIWVQSAWVGPKEWSDQSGQIYKIVDRVDGKLVLP